MTFEVTVAFWLVTGALVALTVGLFKMGAEVERLKRIAFRPVPDISGRAVAALQQPMLAREEKKGAILGNCEPCRALWLSAYPYGPRDHAIRADAIGRPACENCKRTYAVALTPVERRKKARGK